MYKRQSKGEKKLSGAAAGVGFAGSVKKAKPVAKKAVAKKAPVKKIGKIKKGAKAGSR